LKKDTKMTMRAHRTYADNQRETSVSSAKPVELVAMVYQRLLDHLQTGKAQMAAGEDSSESFTKAMEMTAQELAKIEVPVLEGEETWAQRVIDESSLSDWHAGDVPPARKGVYLVEYEIGTWPWPLTAHIEWTGRRWKYDRSENTDIKRWRGLNYDPGE
jgi:hypothetical protein